MTVEEFIADPTWADFLPVMSGSMRPRRLPTHEDCSQLDIEDVAGNLRCGGTLGLMPGYEERPGQIDMSAAIANAFNGGEHLMVEAGTGVGKSLAYLVPAVKWAWTNDTPVIVSTATRNLQSQLMDSDIPRALKILGDDARDFKVALLKGRANYLCLKAAGDFFSSGIWTMTEDEQAAMPGFIDWLHRTDDGDLDGYDGLSRSVLSCPAEECLSRRCPFYSRCFFYKARRAAAEAHLVVVNHALVMADATSGGAGVLPGYQRLVLDEAHNLEDIATDYLSVEFSMPELNRILRRLTRHYREAAVRARALAAAAEALLRFLGRLLPAKHDIERYKANGVYWKDTSRLKSLHDEFERHLLELVHHLHDVCDKSEDTDLNHRLDVAANSLVSYANGAAFVIKGDDENRAYWVERVRPASRRQPYVRLVAAPVSVADDLHKLIYDIKDSVVLCSATLRVGNSFNYMARRLGCRERFQMVTAESPFDYLRQARVLAADFLPDPSVQGEAYVEAFSSLLGPLFKATRGRALVLFTSYEMMNAVASRCRSQLAEDGFTLLVQGDGVSREAMTRKLRDDDHTILFGAQSFWEGVDVVGDALSCVVLTRLPFAQRGDPVVEARSERIERDGGRPFFDYSLPEAVVKFRQGFGRLVRTKSDRGVVVVTDPRFVTKGYGKIFRNSLPTSVHSVSDRDALIECVLEFL